MLFKNLDGDALRGVAEKAVECRFAPGAVLFFKGEPARGLFVLARGVVCGFRIDGEGREQVIFVEHAPATVAEVPVFDGGPYFSTAIAEEETLAYFIDKAYIRRLCQENPAFAVSGLKVMAQKIRNLAALVEELKLHEVSRRLARFLLSEADRRGELAGGEVRLQLNLTRSQIAVRIGTVREVVSRNLKFLHSEGLIRFEDCRLVITDRERFTRYAKAASE